MLTETKQNYIKWNCHFSVKGVSTPLVKRISCGTKKIYKYLSYSLIEWLSMLTDSYVRPRSTTWMQSTLNSILLLFISDELIVRNGTSTHYNRKPHNLITLGQTKSDNNNRLIFIKKSLVNGIQETWSH